MKKIIFLCLLSLLLAGLTLPLTVADVLSINYPAANDIISESSRIRLNVTSNGTSDGCYFTYDGTKNQSVSCNGISLVNMPNADETYRIRVTDNAGSYVDQQLTIKKPAPSTTNFLFLITVLLLCGSLFLLFYLLKKLVTLDMRWFDLAVSFVFFFAFLIVYQLDLEYLNIPFIFDYLDVFFQGSIYALVVFPVIAYFVCGTARSFKKKKHLKAEEM